MVRRSPDQKSTNQANIQLGMIQERELFPFWLDYHVSFLNRSWTQGVEEGLFEVRVRDSGVLCIE